MTDERAEVVVIGAGIAGASLAWCLAEAGLTDVVVLERERQPGMHTTGRSAATLVEIDDVRTLQRLKALGGAFFHAQPPGFAEHPVLERRGVLELLGDAAWRDVDTRLAALAADGLRVEALDADAAGARVGGLLDATAFAGALWLPDDGHLDVHELLTSYIRHARRAGVRFRWDAEVVGIDVDGGRCCAVVTRESRIATRWVVNASGAWAMHVAALAGAAPIRLTPLRRTALTFPAPAGADTTAWPVVRDTTRSFYFRADPMGVLFSPMDETPMEPCDPRADDEAIAAGLDRLAALAPALLSRSIARRWAGLRTFAPDRVPVVGEDPRVAGFFWLAGQGGCGIETSPALGRIAADLLTTGRTERFDAALLAPGRATCG